MPKEATQKKAKAGGKAPGIAVFIHGRRGYAAAAEHLALTLQKYDTETPLHLWAAEGMEFDPSLFTKVHTLPAKAYAQGPGTMKLNVHGLLPKGDWLYLDADTLVASDPRPYIERLKPHDFAIHLQGIGGEHDAIPYTPWATQATIKEVVGAKAGATYFGAQSSYMWIRKGADLPKRIFEEALSLPFEQKHLKERWGNDIPDELRISAALTSLGITPHTEHLMFYGSGHTYNGLTQVAAAFPFLCLYGDNRQHRLVRPTWMKDYDRYLQNVYKSAGRTYAYKLDLVMRDKYVNRP